MTIAILGGRFDPPHWGHFWLAQQVLEKRQEIDEVWFMPAAKHQWKKIEAAGKHRLAMLQCFKNKKFRISDIELIRGGVSYTVDTVKAIKSKYKCTLYWVVGSDIISEFDRWEKAEELPSLVTFLVFPRDPYKIPNKLPRGFEPITGSDLIVTNLSSTIIRRRVREGKSIRGFVPRRIEEYIKSNNLYK